MSDTEKRFRVAFSFTGEKRDFVGAVAKTLAERFGEDAILYDKFHEAEFARGDLGIYLPELYHNQVDLIVVVICGDYETKQWTGLEWTAIHAALTERSDGEVLFCRFDHAKVKGIYSTAGFIELDDRTPGDAAKLILQRLALNEGKQKNFYIDPSAGESSARDFVYISYRHRDRIWQQRLRAVLDADGDLKGLIWDDSEIHRGAEFAEEIEKHVARARVMIMLTSEDYFGPDCGAADCEIKPALAAHEKGETIILWAPVRAHDYRSCPVGHITAATGAGAVALETLDDAGQKNALERIHEEVRRSLGLEIAVRNPSIAFHGPVVAQPSSGAGKMAGKNLGGFYLSKIMGGLVLMAIAVGSSLISNRSCSPPIPSTKEIGSAKELDEIRQMVSALLTQLPEQLPEQLPKQSKGAAIEREAEKRIEEPDRYRAKSYYWPNGTTVRIGFLDGSDSLQEQVMSVGKEWTKYANIKFLKAASDEADVRVSFKQPGEWSYAGTQCLAVPKDQVTTNLGIDFEEQLESRYMIVHCFGHMLGLIHEHQSPAAAPYIDLDKAYRYFSGPPNYWDKESVDANMRPLTDAGEAYKDKLFDRFSVMLYKFPHEILKSDVEFEPGDQISPGDIALIRKIYPKPKSEE